MSTGFIQLLIFGIIVATANVLGGLILFPSKIHQNHKKFLKYILALGSGFMLAVTFIEVLPETVNIWQTQEILPKTSERLYIPMLLLLTGYLLTHFFEHTVAPHFHLGEEVHSENLIKPISAYTAIGGLMIHTFFDGVSIAAASLVDYKIGFLVFIAVFLHKFPEGFTIGSLILAAGKGLKEVLWATSLIGLTTLSGVLLFYFVGANLGFTIAYALPLACGVTIYVAASDLIPEVNHHAGKSPLVSVSVFAGVALFFVLHFLLHEVWEN
jgi:zinc transporter ZupT